VAEEEILRLVRRARDGDANAFGTLVSLFEVQALSVGVRVLRDADEARDAVQEALLSAFRYLGSYRPGRPFRAWLMRIVLNEALDRRRIRSERPERGWTAAEPEAPSVSPDQERDLIAAETRRALEALLDELTPRERAAFVLRDVEGWPTAEVAEALGCRESTARRHLSLARQRLRALLRRRHPELAGPGRKD
jgi:RNA polymerase sigma-70 factor (ECF subfamily)